MENLEQFAKQRLDWNRQRLTLHESQQARLTVPHNGGLFTVDMTLLVYLRTTTVDECVLVDSYGNPVQVDVAQLLEQCEQRWQEVLNDWHNQYQQLKSVRKVESL